jgi:RNA polymerase sigma factor (sigma-70 family)
MPVKLSGERLKEEQILLDGFVKSERKILLFFYESHLPIVINYIRKNGGNDEDARDVFQEALLVLYKQAKSGEFVLLASLKTYIFSICRHQWLKLLRKNQRVESFDESLEIIDLSSDIVQQVEKAEKFRLLQTRLSKMSESSQQILNLHFQNYSTEEIAHKLGFSKLEVKKRKEEFIKKLIESIWNDLR